VRLPFIALFSLSTWLMYRLTSILFSPLAGVWAVVAFNLSPVFGATSASWVLPDGPLISALLGFMICLVHASDLESHCSWGWWLGAGLCAGLALLSKYSAILVLFGAAMAVLAHPTHRGWLLHPQSWVAMALAVMLFSPVIVWNADHHWCSLAFQGGRALGIQWHPFAPLMILGGESLYLLPWIWLPLMVALVTAWRRGRTDWPSWLLACSGTLPVVLFALIGLWSQSRVLFHWAVPGYLVLYPLLGATLARRARTSGRTLRWIAATSGCLIVVGFTVVSSEVRWNWLPAIGEHFASGADPDLAAVNWTSLEAEMRTHGLIGRGKPVVAAMRWDYAGKLDYALGGAATVICLGDDPREYGLTRPASAHWGEDILILAPGARPAQFDRELGKLFESVEPLPALAVLHNGRLAMMIPAYLGRHLRESAAND
jgi:hypothetical protein